MLPLMEVQIQMAKFIRILPKLKNNGLNNANIDCTTLEVRCYKWDIWKKARMISLEKSKNIKENIFLLTMKELRTR